MPCTVQPKILPALLALTVPAVTPATLAPAVMPELPCPGPPCALAATAVADTTKRIVSKIASTFFNLLCSIIHSTPLIFIYIYFNSVRTYPVELKKIKWRKANFTRNNALTRYSK
jgi:hypothetical protein